MNENTKWQDYGMICMAMGSKAIGKLEKAIEEESIRDDFEA